MCGTTLHILPSNDRRKLENSEKVGELGENWRNSENFGEYGCLLMGYMDTQKLRKSHTGVALCWPTAQKGRNGHQVLEKRLYIKQLWIFAETCLILSDLVVCDSRQRSFCSSSEIFVEARGRLGQTLPLHIRPASSR